MNEENAVPSKHDFIILVMVDSFQETVFGISSPPVITFFYKAIKLSIFANVVIEELI